MNFLDERIKCLFKRHWRQTLTYWSVFFSFGLCIAFLGPTIADLRCQTHTTLQQITWVFFFQQLFLLVGSSVGGLFKRTLLCSLTALFSSTFLISLVFAVIPLCHHVVLLSIAMALAGTAMGVIDTIANLQLVKLYQKDSAVFLQVLHFFIGLGALVSPLVADPFLTDGCVEDANRTDNSSSPAMFSTPSEPPHPHTTVGMFHNSSKYLLSTDDNIVTNVSYAFWIMALINLPVPAVVLALMYHEKMLPCSQDRQRLLDRDSSPSAGHAGEAETDQENAFKCFNLEKLRNRPPTFIFIHMLGGAILFLTDGIIGAYAGFVYTYAISTPLSMGHKTAGYLDSIFWAAITLGRLAFIYLSFVFQAKRLIPISLIAVILVQFSLLIFYSSKVFLFVGTCVLGLSISGVFPSMVAFTEDILDYKGCATTVLVTSASTGEMMLQVIVGSVIQSDGSYAFLLCNTVASCLSLALFGLLLYAQHSHRNAQSDSSRGEAMTEKPNFGG